MNNFSAFFLLNFFVFSNNVESLLTLESGSEIIIKTAIDGILSANCSLLSFGTTSCSSYPHVSISQENLGKPCFTQLYFRYYGIYATKCRCHKSVTGVGLIYIPIKIPTLPVLNCPVTTGYRFVDFMTTDTPSTHTPSQTAYVQFQTGERISVFTNKQDLTFGTMIVDTYATDKGYVQLICNIKNVNAPVCSAVDYVFVCTYERNASATDLEALTTPLKGYPYFFGNNLTPMNQTNCEAPLLGGDLSETIDLVQSPGAVINALQTQTPSPNVTKLVAAIGTTACSSFPKINKTIINFPKVCFVQKETPVPNQVSARCKEKKFTVNSAGVTIPIDILKGTTLTTGTAKVTYKTASGGTVTDENTFVETAAALMLLISLKKSPYILQETQAIVSYTDKGYSFISCSMNDPKRPTCTGITYAGVCTYARNETADVISVLVQPFNDSPYFIGGSLVSVDQTNC